MTAREIQNLREGDVIFDIEQNKGYHISKVHEGHVEYTESVLGAGSIPTQYLLLWNYVSLMREREEEWSEEDEEAVKEIRAMFNRGTFLCPDIQFLSNWLVSIKRRITTSHWKPSEEQMDALECAERWYSDNMGHNPALYRLLCDLKKL